MVHGRAAGAGSRSANMFGDEIRRRRKERVWTQEQLSAAAGLSVHYLSGIENGRRDPSLSTIEALATALDISPGELVGGVDGLTPEAIDAARNFSRLSAEARTAVLGLMRLLSTKR